MSEKKVTDTVEENGGGTVKKRRKFNIIAFILCFLAAFFIWLYAVNAGEKDRAEEQSDAVAENGDCETEGSTLSFGDLLFGEL